MERTVKVYALYNKITLDFYIGTTTQPLCHHIKYIRTKYKAYIKPDTELNQFLLCNDKKSLKIELINEFPMSDQQAIIDQIMESRDTFFTKLCYHNQSVYTPMIIH